MEQHDASAFDIRTYSLKIVNHVPRIMASVNDSQINRSLFAMLGEIELQRILKQLGNPRSIAMRAIDATDFFRCQSKRREPPGLLRGWSVDRENARRWALAAKICNGVSMSRPKLDDQRRIKKSGDLHEGGKIVMLPGIHRRKADFFRYSGLDFYFAP